MMEKILSFQIDHTKLTRGMYLSRVDGDIDTFDLRTRLPNREPVMENGAMHTIEHLFATFVRNSDVAEQVVYFGPMGCRTGFYFLTRGMKRQKAIDLTRAAFAFMREKFRALRSVNAATGATMIWMGPKKNHKKWKKFWRIGQAFS